MGFCDRCWPMFETTCCTVARIAAVRLYKLILAGLRCAELPDGLEGLAGYMLLEGLRIGLGGADDIVVVFGFVFEVSDFTEDCWASIP